MIEIGLDNKSIHYLIKKKFLGQDIIIQIYIPLKKKKN